MSKDRILHFVITFQASATEIAGRVMKKATRRRVNPMAAGGGGAAADGGSEPKKNAFASFGGFSAAKAPATAGSDAFGFLKSGI